MAQEVEYGMSTIRPGAASSFARVAYCVAGGKPVTIDVVGVHRLRLHSSYVEVGKCVHYNYHCVGCGLSADFSLEHDPACRFGRRLYLTALSVGTQARFYGVPGLEPEPELKEWVARKRGPAPPGFAFDAFDLASHQYMRFLHPAGGSPRYYDPRGERISAEEFDRMCATWELPVVVTAGFGTHVEYPPDGSSRLSVDRVARGRAQDGRLFYVLDGSRVYEEDVRRLAFRASGDELVFMHPDREVVDAARALFEVAPALRAQVGEFEGVLQSALLSALKEAGADAARRIRLFYEIRDKVAAGLVALLTNAGVAAAERREARRRELLEKTPLGRTALALQTMRSETAAALDREIEEAVVPAVDLGKMTRSQAERVAEWQMRQHSETDVRRLDYGDFIFADGPRPVAEGEGLLISQADPDERPRFVDAAGPVKPTETLVSALNTRLTRTIRLRE